MYYTEWLPPTPFLILTPRWASYKLSCLYLQWCRHIGRNWSGCHWEIGAAGYVVRKGRMVAPTIWLKFHLIFMCNPLSLGKDMQSVTIWSPSVLPQPRITHWEKKKTMWKNPLISICRRLNQLILLFGKLPINSSSIIPSAVKSCPWQLNSI